MPATSRHQPSARLLVLLALLALALPSRAAGASAGPPVVLLPGIAGSQLEILLGDSYVAPHFCCRQHSAEWKRVWFQLKDYVATDCLAHELHVNVEGGARYTNSAGVRVRAVDFGGVDGIKCLDSAFCSLTAYFQPVISLLEENGYRVNDTIFGAPYDFRMAGDGLTQVGFEAALTELIEDVVAKRGGERVVLVAHSMGGMVATYFLAGKSQNWTRAHVAGLVTISSPYAGSPMALQGSVSGDPIGLPFDHDAFLGIQGVRTSEDDLGEPSLALSHPCTIHSLARSLAPSCLFLVHFFSGDNSAAILLCRRRIRPAVLGSTRRLDLATRPSRFWFAQKERITRERSRVTGRF